MGFWQRVSKTLMILAGMSLLMLQFQNCRAPETNKNGGSPSLNGNTNNNGGLNDQFTASGGNGDIYTGKRTLVAQDSGAYQNESALSILQSRQQYFRILEDYKCGGQELVPYAAKIAAGPQSNAEKETCDQRTEVGFDYDISPYSPLYLTQDNHIYMYYRRSPGFRIPLYNEVYCRAEGSGATGIDIAINRFKDGDKQATIYIGEETDGGEYFSRIVRPFFVKNVDVDGYTYYYSPEFEFVITLVTASGRIVSALAKATIDDKQRELNMNCSYNGLPEKEYEVSDHYGSATTCSSDADWCIGANQQYKVPSDVLGNAQKTTRIQNGDIVEILPGVYNDTARIDKDNVTVRSVPGSKAKIDCNGLVVYQQKACLFNMGQNTKIEDLIITGARGDQENEACLRNQPGRHTYVKGVVCYDSNTGIMGSGGNWYVEDSIFYNNGSPNKPDKSHNLNFTDSGGYTCEEVHLTNIMSRDASYEAALKNRCRNLVIENSLLIDGQTGRALDSSYGGNVLLKNTVVFQPQSENNTILDHGPERTIETCLPGSLQLENVIVINHNHRGRIRSKCAPLVIDEDSIFQGPINFIEPQ